MVADITVVFDDPRAQEAVRNDIKSQSIESVWGNKQLQTPPLIIVNRWGKSRSSNSASCHSLSQQVNVNLCQLEGTWLANATPVKRGEKKFSPTTTHDVIHLYISKPESDYKVYPSNEIRAI